MSATVLDALLVTLGLDSSDFTAGTNEVSTGLSKLRKDSEKTAKTMAEQGEKAAEFFRSIRNEMLALVGVSLTLKAVKDTIIETTHSLADMGRTATLIGESARTVDAWGNAVKGFGGSAKDAQASMLGLQDSITSFQMTGQSNSTTQTLRAMGIQFLDENNKPRKSSEILLEVARYFEKINATPQQARQFGKMLGIDQGMINMLMQGSDATRSYVAEQEKISAVNEQNVRAMQDMERMWANLDSQWMATKATLVTALQPQIEQLTKWLLKVSQWVRDHDDEIQKFFAELPGKIKPITDAIQDAVTAVGGWENALDILLTFVVGKWGLGMLAGIAKVSSAILALPTALAVAITAVAGVEAYRRIQAMVNGEQYGGAPSHSQEMSELERLQRRNWEQNNPGKPFPGTQQEQMTQTQERAAASTRLGWLSGKFAQLEARYNLPAGLLNSVAMTESSGNQFAVGPETKYGRAKGLFQLIPGTAKELGLKEGEEFDPEKSSEAAAKYLSQLIRQFGGNVNTALAAYNWGPGNVAKKGLENMPMETRNYLQKINGGMPMGASARLPSNTSGRGGGSSVHSETNIGQITINTQATDAQGIAKEIPTHLQRNPLVYQADSGMS